jgi:hypothetical protein
MDQKSSPIIQNKTGSLKYEDANPEQPPRTTFGTCRSYPDTYSYLGKADLRLQIDTSVSKKRSHSRHAGKSTLSSNIAPTRPIKPRGHKRGSFVDH